MESKTVTPAGLGTTPHLVYAIIIDQGQLYMDLTGIFRVGSSKEKWYVAVGYSYDGNYVKPFPIRSRSTYEWLKAYAVIHQ
jgi:hypothetical protein